VHLEKGLRVLVAIQQTDLDTAVSGIELSQPALSVDWNKHQEDSDFLSCSLRLDSFIRVGQLMTANETLIAEIAGHLQSTKIAEAIAHRAEMLSACLQDKTFEHSDPDDHGRGWDACRDPCPLLPRQPYVKRHEAMPNAPQNSGKLDFSQVPKHG
jgi:hypothetical protein